MDINQIIPATANKLITLEDFLRYYFKYHVVKTGEDHPGIQGKTRITTLNEDVIVIAFEQYRRNVEGRLSAWYAVNRDNPLPSLERSSDNFIVNFVPQELIFLTDEHLKLLQQVNDLKAVLISKDLGYVLNTAAFQ